MNEWVIRLLRNKIVAAALSVALGVALILARRAAVELLVKIIGGLVIAGGVGFIALYLFGPNGRDLTALASGCAAVLIGLLVIIYADVVDDFFVTLMGVVLILNGLSNVAGAGVDRENRILAILFGAAVMVLGLLVVFHPGAIEDAIIVYIGVFFVLNGLADLFLLHRMKDVLLPGRGKDE